jgi:hypothetical protein
VRYHLNGTKPESDEQKRSAMSGSIRSARKDGLIEATDRTVTIRVGTRNARQTVWHSLCYSPGTDDDEEEE